MRWFKRSNTHDTKPPDETRPRRPREGREATREHDRPRRERYSAWNDPDLPLYGDPFDG